MSEQPTTDLVEVTAEIVASFVSNNPVAPDGVSDLVRSVHGALRGLKSATTSPVPAEAPKPLVPIKKTVTPDYLISLEDGGRYKSLKRHLAVRGLTPEQYRQKWELPADYPMVSPNYSEARSSLAKAVGLGRKRSKPVVTLKGRKRKA